MFKKYLVCILCVALALFFSTFSFSQDDPTATGEKKVEESTDKKEETKKEVSDDAKKEKEADKITVTALEAKTFFDGLNTYVNSRVLFKLTSQDNLVIDKIEYKIDAGEVKNYDQPFSIADEGKHMITYYSIDKIGNKEEEKRFKVIVDNTPPEIVVTTNRPVLKIGSKVYISKDFTFTINAKDALSGVNKVEYATDGKTYREYIAPFSIPAEGEVEIKAKALDNVTNITEKFVMNLVDETGKAVDLQDVSIKLSTDNVPPTVVITPDKELKKKDDKSIASADNKYTVTATDNESGVATILVRVDAKGDFIPYMNEIKFTTNGEHTIEAKSIDKVGNVSSVAILSVYVDIIPPETKIETLSK